MGGINHPQMEGMATDLGSGRATVKLPAAWGKNGFVGFLCEDDPENLDQLGVNWILDHHASLWINMNNIEQYNIIYIYMYIYQQYGSMSEWILEGRY